MTSVYNIFLSTLLIVFCWSVISSAEIVDTNVDAEIQFAAFKKKFNKNYSAEEEERKLRIFRANLKKIQALNEFEEGTAVYGVTEFTDLSKSEFRNLLGLKARPRQNPTKKENLPIAKFKDINLPEYFDWRDHNAVTPVKNQGMCGSCWAFSVTGNVEGQYAINTGQLLSFSEQELVDCDKKDQGCGGGEMTDAYTAIKNIGGLEEESSYPYEGHNDRCKFSPRKVRVKVVDYVNITANEVDIANYLFKSGPVSIGLNANAMQFYFGGVSNPPKFLCNPNNLDHGVLLTGFGIQKTKFTKKMQPYWAIKNSWGTYWGERGYYKLYRGKGVCGVDQMATSAIIQ